MSSYTYFERKIAKFLRSSPMLKAFMKIAYLTVMRMISFRFKKVECNQKFQSIHSFRESFFGYFDKNPSNGEGLLLFHSSEFDTSKSPKLAKFITVNLMNERTKEILWSMKSKAFNWQQGARLQWLTNEEFIFNDFDKKRRIYVSKLVSAKDFSITEFDLPVQDAYQKEYFLSLNYSRLAALSPDYGYHCLPKLSKESLSNYSQDGIWKMEISSKKKMLILPFSKILELESQPEFSQSDHEVNHVQISPDGKKFIFLHRYTFKGLRHDRLILVDEISTNMKLLSHSNLISHYCWLDNNSLAIYQSLKGYRESYFYLNIKKLDWIRIEGLDKYGDGHPSGKHKQIITDTYPDRSGMQSLFFVEDLENNNSIQLLGKFYHPLKFRGSARCDLHPRYDTNRGVVYFDSAFSGKRQFYKMDLI